MNTLRALLALGSWGGLGGSKAWPGLATLGLFIVSDERGPFPPSVTLGAGPKASLRYPWPGP